MSKFERAFLAANSTNFHPIEDPRWNVVAEAIGEALLHERAQLPPVLVGRCEAPFLDGTRCPADGLLTKLHDEVGKDAFLCPRHGADLARAVRRWPR